MDQPLLRTGPRWPFSPFLEESSCPIPEDVTKRVTKMHVALFADEDPSLSDVLSTTVGGLNVLLRRVNLECLWIWIESTLGVLANDPGAISDQDMKDCCSRVHCAFEDWDRLAPEDVAYHLVRSACVREAHESFQSRFGKFVVKKAKKQKEAHLMVDVPHDHASEETPTASEVLLSKRKEEHIERRKSFESPQLKEKTPSGRMLSTPDKEVEEEHEFGVSPLSPADQVKRRRHTAYDVGSAMTTPHGRMMKPGDAYQGAIKSFEKEKKEHGERSRSQSMIMSPNSPRTRSPTTASPSAGNVGGYQRSPRSMSVFASKSPLAKSSSPHDGSYARTARSGSVSSSPRSPRSPLVTRVGMGTVTSPRPRSPKPTSPSSPFDRTLSDLAAQRDKIQALRQRLESTDM
eukprot:TRINITY_DN3072_c0_g1_i1.p1 TRINITY_DN3072_c0_g1~~TRINITY_DN3072_c0_g1_i1.p1  ORF type:complete len:432 (-),score=109.49 TRINITY_DN3072_c0_g1_i1:285-1493(-)